MKKARQKIFITCNQCGERFTLRGTSEGKGMHGTGFKKCICDNEKNFNLRTEDL